jgi:fatty-acid peroxygenase
MDRGADRGKQGGLPACFRRTALLQIIAHFQDVDGRKLSPQTAAVELINVLRPTVAVARFITFAAVALHHHPENVEKLRKDENFVEIFVQEVRRYYPFFPFVAARVKKSFQWKGYDFPQGQKVLLDLYGTDIDPGTWDSPEKFQPERFYGWDKSPFNFIPQGGGDHYLNHRCPGEWITIELMKEAVLFLSRDLEYRVPDQNLHISYRRIPAIPKSRLVLSNVKRRSIV